MRLLFRTMILLLGTSFSGWTHGYHVSITQIDYNEQTKSFEIAIKLITEDIERVLEQQGADRLLLGEDNESEKAEEYIREYLKQNFIVYINDIALEQIYMGKEVEEGETWCYIEIKDVSEMSSLTVKSTIFISEYHSQTNRVNLNVRGRGDSFVLSPGKTEDKIIFE